ncbi:cytochrome P450 [Bacillus sp. SM2101]|uniref:cytochrome P450 family protein n=1 Tax=Bacillus sp. SM2101 TaxID=2805366 RepID=UPI001BDE1C0D|nr:cytochrome P450 [Bacillus sp. SM2101]
MEKLVFNLYSKEYQLNPYPTLSYFREHDPIHEFMFKYGKREVRSWLVTRYDDILTLFKDERITKNIQNLMSKEEIKQKSKIKEIDYIINNMLSKDPPDHTRLRSLVHKVFTPRMIERLRTRIEDISENLLDNLELNSDVELMEDYAVPLPIIIISEMMGIPVEDRNKFRKWSNAITDVSNGTEEIEKLNSSIQEFVNYLEKIIEERKKSPKDDVISGLVMAKEEGEKLSKNELLSMLFLLIVAGHETTVNLIGNGMLALLQNPEQLAKLREHPENMKTAIEELLRYTNPVELATSRYALEDFIFQGKEIKKGDMIFLGLAAANRDPKYFNDPEKLDITRKENKHLAFGHGIHFCLGAPLARLEANIAINALINRFPNIKLNVSEEDIQWRHSEILRGLVQLPIKLQ